MKSQEIQTPEQPVVATIPLMLETVNKEDTGGRLSGELGPLPRRKHDKATTPKDMKMIIAGRGAMNTLTRAVTM